jgi:hypothetical protein
MRKKLAVLGVTVVALALLGAVAPSVVAPKANRAEALTRCGVGSGGVIARNGPYAAWVNMCVEHLGEGVRALAYVHCYTGSGDVPCNWEFRDLELWRGSPADPDRVRWVHGYAHQTGVRNGYIAAEDHGWGPCLNTIVGGIWFGQSPRIYIRFPNGVLSGPRSLTGASVVHQDCS